MITIKTIAVPKKGSNYYGSSSSSSNPPSNIASVDISGLDLMWKKGEGQNSLIPTYSNNVTSNESEVAVGHFNISDEGALFGVGNGTDDEKRSNALTVFSNGKSVSPIFNATTKIDTPLALVTKLQSNTIVNAGDVKSNTFTGNSATITTINGTTASISTINSSNITNTGNINTDTINSNNITNTDTIKTKNLQVTGSAHFFELIIDKIKSAGGSIMLTPADGFEVEKIKSMANNFTLYWRCQDGNGKQRDNMWKVNDQALCMSFNQATVGTSHNVNNKYYWCLVTDVSDNNNPIEIDGEFYNYISISRFDSVGVVNPEIGDSIVMCGYRGTDDAARQSAIYISAYSSLDEGLTAPLLAQYQGINDFNLESHRTSYYDAVGAKFVGDFEVEGKNVIDYIKDKVDDKYSSLSVTVDGINTKVVNNTTEITKLGNNLDITNNNITSLQKTVTDNYSTLDQKADGISAKVSENTTTINNINGQVTTNKTDIANLTIKANGIESTVSNMTKSNGANLFSFTNTDFQSFWCRSAIQMNGFFTLKLNQRIYRLQNLGTNNEGGDFVVSFDARVLKNTTVNVNFCNIGAEENHGDIALTTAFQHYVLHFKNIQSEYLNKALYNGFIDFEPKTPDETNQLYVANFMLERGTIPSEKFSISEADRNNYGKESFTDWEKYPTVQIVNETINGNSVQAYKVEGVPSGETYIDILKRENLQNKMKIQPQKVYTLSFWAKASESGHRIYCFLYPNISDTGLNGVIYKGVNGAGTQEQKTSSEDGSTLCELDSTWRKFYIHWHPHKVGDTINCNVGRLYYNMVVWLSDVKLEEGYICDENLTSQETYSSIKQTADSITSTVTSMKDDILGANCMLGLNGQGWSSNTIYEDAGNSFHCESTDWFQSPPIMDFSGDYTFSFGLWNDNLQIKILDFTQTYYDDGIYDQYVDFGTKTPCKILTTSATVPNAALTNYATSGTSSNWTYSNTETITLKVGDNVAVRVTNGDNNRYNSIYGTVSAINTSSKSVKVQAIKLLDQPNVICTLTCPKDKKDGTAINSLHYDEKLGRYWIRFKESRGTAKTFVMLFRNLSASTIGWISRLMLEESVEYPHKYNNTGQTSQSMIKQTAESIMMSVNDTYLKIGDGNITLNGDTKVNGSLTLNDEKQGFLLVGNGGTTEISPNSIGTFNEFASKTTNVIKTNYDSKIYGYKAEDGDYYRFSWTVLQRLGTFKKGTYIKILNYTNYAYAIGATSHINTPYATFYIYENGTTTKTINLNNNTSVDIANYTVVGDNVDVIVDGHFTIGVPTSIWGANGNPHPAIGVSVNWNNEVPKASSTFMLIGYDGFAANFGTNTTVYCGKDGFIANYGDSLFKITPDGIVEKRNRASIKVIEGSTSSSNPYTYEVPDTVDTILCKTGNTIIKLPSKPYQGQVVKIHDKSRSGETWINFQGYMVRANETYNDRRYQSKFPCDGQYVRIYTFIDDTWYEEFTG